MTLYVGVDLHPHQLTIAWFDTQTGETSSIDLKHDLEKVHEFYSSLPEPAIIGIEASAKMSWFERKIGVRPTFLMIRFEFLSCLVSPRSIG